MNSRVVNLMLQIIAILTRYFLQMALFRKFSFFEIGELNIYLTFFTLSTIISGLEFHYLANREIALSGENRIDSVAFRLLSALFLTTVGCAIYLAINSPSGVNGSSVLFIAIAFIEYTNLELSRLLVVCRKYIIANIFGIIRSVSPYLPFTLERPTIADCLDFMFVICLACAMAQLYLTTKTANIKFRAGGFYWGKINLIWPFFLTGVITSATAFTERYAIRDVLGSEALGRYAIALIFVTATDTFINGFFIQPNYATILRDLSQPQTRHIMIRKIFLVGLFSAAAASLIAVIFGDFLYALLNKPAPSSSFIICALFAGFSKTLWSSLYYLYYANRAESKFSRVQIAFTAVTLLIFYLTLKLTHDIQAGLISSAAAGVGIYFYGVSLIAHPQHPK
ncbi:MAG: lipopolysaccharide biosynthesis protein [Acidobacteriota bacterium]